MPNWTEILQEIQHEAATQQMPLDFVRRKYLKKLHENTGRNIICYYSGWLQKPGQYNTHINDDDKNGFMNAVHNLDKSKGLDLFLHTPGGDIAATESIVHYLRSIFGNDIRAVIPQLAMSAGTMIACSCSEIIMGKQSNLGPIDPQFNGIPAHGVIEEFKKAVEEIKDNPESIPLWQQIVGKYHPTFLGECEKAIEWSEHIVRTWLETGMFRNYDATQRASLSQSITAKMSDHGSHKSHSRHIHIEDLIDMGLKIIQLENDQKLQDLVLSVHHAFMHTLAGSQAFKIIENHNGQAVIHQSA